MTWIEQVWAGTIKMLITYLVYGSSAFVLLFYCDNLWQQSASMSTEKQKMLGGELYDASDARLAAERRRCRMLLRQLNNSNEEETELRGQILKELIPSQVAGLWIEPPFYCDYGTNIRAGSKVYFNFNCIVLDVMEVRIGDRVLFGPSVQLLTPLHPMNRKDRAAGLEYAKGIVIGSDVWVGGGAIICPGVTVGNRCIIGAGSVVTKDIPDDVFAAGNPCKIIRRLEH